MTQTQRILKHLETVGSITPREALDLFGCMRLGARIWDLRRAGYPIMKTMECRKNRNGERVSYARYSLKEGA